MKKVHEQTLRLLELARTGKYTADELATMLGSTRAKVNAICYRYLVQLKRLRRHVPDRPTHGQDSGIISLGRVNTRVPNWALRESGLVRFDRCRVRVDGSKIVLEPV